MILLLQNSGPPPEVESIVVLPSTDQVTYINGTIQFRAFAVYDDSSVSDVSDSTTWPDLLPWAFIDSNGLLTALDRHTFEEGEFEATFEAFSAPLPQIAIVNNTEIFIEDDLSTAPHGLYFTVEILDAIDTIELMDSDDPTWSMRITNVDGFQAGDIIYGSSDYNNKFLLRTRGNTTISIVEMILPGSVWPMIFPGENRFVWSPSSVRWLSASYIPTYWGV